MSGITILQILMKAYILPLLPELPLSYKILNGGLLHSTSTYFIEPYTRNHIAYIFRLKIF